MLGALELDDTAQVARIEQELRVVATVDRDLGQRVRPQPAGETLDEAEQLERAERLREVGIGAGIRGVSRHQVDETRQEHDRDRGSTQVGLERAAEVEPGLAGEPHVEDDHVGLLGGERGPCRRRRRCLVHVDLDIFERGPDQREQSRIVVYYQQAQATTPPIVASGQLSTDRRGRTYPERGNLREELSRT